MQNEIWKDIPNYEGLYQASNLGNVRSLKSNKLLKPTKDVYYYKVGLYKNKKQKKFTVHQLVAICFLNHKPSGYKKVVNHINFNSFDNNVRNLELVSSRENSNKKHLKSSSKYTGVSWYKPYKKWMAYIYKNGKLKNLGYFSSEIEASLTYENELLKLNK
jgi:hypothetical protein